MNLDTIKKRINSLLVQADEVLATEHKSHMGRAVDLEAIRALRAAALSFILAVYGKEHPHYSEFVENVDTDWVTHAKTAKHLLQVIKIEIDEGWLTSFRGLIAAELFTDFIEMAEHLLEEGYKDPAAVVAGSVLEEHLRQLCIANSIPIYNTKSGTNKPIKADRLNAELSAKGVYSKLDQKAVTNWLGLRNSAAHGNYDDYTNEQVKLMVSGITDFMVRNPS